MVGQTIIEIDFDGVKTTNSNYRFHHYQDCCESITSFKIGEFSNVIGEKVILAEEDSKDMPGYTGGYDSSHSWSNFYIETAKGRLELYFLGESNGYYGEEVVFEKLVD